MPSNVPWRPSSARIRFACAVLAGLAVVTAFGANRDAREPLPDPVSPIDQLRLHRELADLDLRVGDLVFRRRASFLSQRVLTHDPAGHFSHVGLLVPDPRAPGRLGVVHVVPAAGEPGEGRVELAPLSEFLDATATLRSAVYRVNVAEDTRHAATRHGLRYFTEGRAFDGAFDLDDQDRLYCTELVWAAYRDAGLDLIDHPLAVIDVLGLHRRPILKPSDLQRSESLEVVWEFAVTPHSTLKGTAP